MNRSWPEAALQFEASVRARLAREGGVELTRRAEDKPETRVEVLKPALDDLGVLELDVYGDEDESAAVVRAVRVAGEVVAPWPLSRVLSVPTQLRAEVDAVYVIDGEATFLDHADLFDAAVSVQLQGDRTASVHPAGPRDRVPLDPFGVPVDTSQASDVVVGEHVRVMSCVLDGFWVSGALSTAAMSAAQYAGTRHQFGKPIGKFGEVGTRLADMTVATDGLEELATHTWFLAHRQRATMADALALRVGMLEAAASVLQNAHQVFAAIGLCEEHDLAVIDRHLMPVLTRPAGMSRSTSLLLKAVNQYGFTGTFDVPSRGTRPA